MRKAGYSRVYHEGTCLFLSGKFFKSSENEQRSGKATKTGVK